MTKIKIAISGANGKMGRAVIDEVLSNKKFELSFGIDKNSDDSENGIKIYDSFEYPKDKVDVIIDFSSPSLLPQILSYCVKTQTNAVLCTTGYNEKDKQSIKSASEKIAVFVSPNMSFAVNAVIETAKKLALLLNGFDIEIVEKHHSAKKDCPSGTALKIANGIREVCPGKYALSGRRGLGKRDKNEIGIHSVRGGGITGEHEVIFAGENETVTLTHTAHNRKVFADGALCATEYIYGKKHGLFSFSELLRDIYDKR